MEIELAGQAAAGLENILKTFRALRTEFQNFAKVAEKGINIDRTLKPFLQLSEIIETVGVNLKATNSKATTFGAEAKASATEATAAFKGLDAAVRRVQVDIGRGASSTFGGSATSARAVRERVTGEARARRATRAADDLDFAGWRIKQRIRGASARQETRLARDGERAAARAERDRTKLSNDNFAVERQRMRIRDASDRAELAGIGRANALREKGRAARGRSARHVVAGAHESVRSLERGYGSPAVAATIGAGIAAEVTRKIVMEAARIDDAATRFRMLAVPAGADASVVTGAARAQALKDSIRLGVGADAILDIQSKAVRDGITPEIARTLPKALASAAHLMAAGGDGDVEGLTDKLAETVQQAFAMGWVKTPADARRIVNVEAGLSNFAGNTAEKQEQFVSGGGLGHGKELGWDMKTTQEMGALLNSSGMRTGMASARALGQLSQSVPQMQDKYRHAQRSHQNTDENRAIRQAPSKLGYGSIKEMQAAILSGPLGFADFAERLRNNLDDKMRKLTLKGYGFSEQLGAPLAEVTVAKTKAVMARGDDLAGQTEANDYLSSKFADWQTGLVFMLKQMEAGWKAIEAELGDVIKDDIIVPLRDWWISVSESILNSGMKAKFHSAILGFVHGLGFDDVAGLLRGISGSVGSFDVAGFATGLGEGIRTIAWALHGLFDVLTFGHGGAEAVGKIAAELFGLSLAAMALAPIMGIIGAFAGVLRMISGAAQLTGISTALKTIVGVETAGAATGLLALAGALGVIAAAVQGLISAGVLNKIEVPHDLSKQSWDRFAWGSKPDGSSARPPWVDKLTGASAIPESRTKDDVTPPAASSYWIKKNAYLHRESYDGGVNRSNLLTNASWTGGNGSAEEIKRSIISTDRAVNAIKDSVQRSGGRFTLAAYEAGALAAEGGGFGAALSVSGGGASNLRYGRGDSGAYRGTPGTGGAGTPSKSLLDFIAQSEGGGYNTSQGNGKFLPGGKEQNLTGKSLNEILELGKGMIAQSGSSAMGRYQITGGTIRDLMGRMGLSGNEKYDEKMQDAMASKLISDEGPRALNRWEGLKRGGRMATAQGLLSAGSIASIPGIGSNIPGGGGNPGSAVDMAMRMQGMGEQASGSALGKYMNHGEWCADFVNGIMAKNGIQGSGSAMASSFNKWGRLVSPADVKKGDVITENRGGNSPTHHVGIATGEVHHDRNGNVDSIGMVSGNYGHKVTHNMEPVGIIQGLHRGAEDVPANASRLPPEHHTTPAGDPVHHHHGDVAIHVNGSGDPHVVAGLVSHEFNRHREGRLSDTVAVV